MYISSDFLGGLRLSGKFQGAFLSHPKLLAALMDLDTGLRTQKILGDDFLVTDILTGAFFSQIMVEFGEVKVRNITSENARDVDKKTAKVLVVRSRNVQPFRNCRISRRYLLIPTDILQKTVVGCP